MIEFRICDPGLSWVDIPIFATVNCYRWSPQRPEQARFASEVARFFSDVFDAEVRWNHKGSLQGHYIRK